MIAPNSTQAFPHLHYARRQIVPWNDWARLWLVRCSALLRGSWLEVEVNDLRVDVMPADM
jgi:hypothetical protein